MENLYSFMKFYDSIIYIWIWQYCQNIILNHCVLKARFLLSRTKIINNCIMETLIKDTFIAIDLSKVLETPILLP